MNRGEAFEASLPKSDYFGDGYFEIRQVLAQATQVSMIHNLKPANVLEIGIGNGFTSIFLKTSGLNITTVDINAELQPDYCVPISMLDKHFATNSFDLVVCCEVLEHLPLAELDNCLDIMRNLGNRLFLTLPTYTHSYGMSGVLKLPRARARTFNWYFHMPKRNSLDNTEHFWEVGYNRDCTKSNIAERLRTRYNQVKCGRIAMKPNQMYFVADQTNSQN